LLCLETRADSTNNSDNSYDLLEDLKAVENDLFTMLDPSIRHHIQKRGIQLKENTYIGFDTEFVKKDLEHNELVSVQLAVTTKTYVHIPKNNVYCISKVDEITNKLIKQTTTTSVSLNYQKIEMSIQSVIKSIRKQKYSEHD
jgi:hypothetical protein